VGIACGLIAVAVLAAVFLRKGPPLAPVPSTQHHAACAAPRITTVAPPKAPIAVRVRLDSTPPGARVVRVSDGVVLGTTPETIELRPSNEPLPLRFEKEGFVAAQREAALGEDSNLFVVLQAVEKTAPRPKKHPPGRAHGWR
jgi:hypothetical protein